MLYTKAFLARPWSSELSEESFGGYLVRGCMATLEPTQHLA